MLITFGRFFSVFLCLTFSNALKSTIFRIKSTYYINITYSKPEENFNNSTRKIKRILTWENKYIENQHSIKYWESKYSNTLSCGDWCGVLSNSSLITVWQKEKQYMALFLFAVINWNVHAPKLSDWNLKTISLLRLHFLHKRSHPYWPHYCWLLGSLLLFLWIFSAVIISSISLFCGEEGNEHLLYITSNNMNLMDTKTPPDESSSSRNRSVSVFSTLRPHLINGIVIICIKSSL